jgi:uncharacterized protein (TIGR00288 family)
MQNDEKRIAVFIDFENVAMGVRESNYGNFDIELVLKRLVEKGKVMVKRAYSDWHRYSEFKRAFHQSAIELIDVPQTRYSGKNSADIRIVVDALDLSHQKDHIDTFVLVSGDSDFSPLVSKLRENGRYVIGMGVKQSSSDLLINNCDEFIYYEDLVRPTPVVTVEEPKLRNLPHKRAEAIRLVMETFQALQREGKEVIYGSMLKQTLVRKLPSFNESYYGYPMFSRLLEDAADHKLLKLTKDLKSGGYIVTGVVEATAQGTPAAANGDVTPEVKQGVETFAAEAVNRAPAGQSELRERPRRSRWGRGRMGRPPLRANEPAQTVKEIPLQGESTTPEVLTRSTLSPEFGDRNPEDTTSLEAPPHPTVDIGEAKDSNENALQVAEEALVITPKETVDIGPSGPSAGIASETVASEGERVSRTGSRRNTRGRGRRTTTTAKKTSKKKP